MSLAYLTIDDGPSINTKAYLDFLLEKRITPIMFFFGDNIKKEWEQGIYAIQKGAIIGNHSYTHPRFSCLSFDECIREIEFQEKMLDELYHDAGVLRKYKLFRFPYGDKGGVHKDVLQKYFSDHGFHRIDDSVINYDWYHERNLHKDFDVLWTFDFGEYMLKEKKGYTYDNILEKIADRNPINSGSLLKENVHNIILIHDHPNTEDFHPNYLYDLINRVMDAGVRFVEPKFIKP